MKNQTNHTAIEWKEVALGNICDVRDGTHESPKYQNEGYPLITSKNIVNGYIDFSHVNLITKKDFDSINKRSKVNIGDILMPMIGTIGNPIIVREKEQFAIKNVALIKFTNKDISNKYIKFLLDSPYFTHVAKKVNRGGTQKFIALGDIREIKIPLPFRNGHPDLETQQKIVAILEKAESLKEKRKQAIKLLDEYTKSVFNEMFGDPISNTKKLPKKFLKEISKEIQTGFAYGKFSDLEGLVHIRPFNISNEGNLDLYQLKYIPIEEVKSEKYFLMKGDLIINTTNSKELVGKTALFNLNKKFSFSNHMTKIRVNESYVNPYYLWFTLNYYQKTGNFKPLIKSWVNQVGIDSSLLRSLEIVIPPIPLQQTFASIVEHVEKLKETQKKSLQDIEQLFNALMQKAFNGELTK